MEKLVQNLNGIFDSIKTCDDKNREIMSKVFMQAISAVCESEVYNALLGQYVFSALFCEESTDLASKLATVSTVSTSDLDVLDKSETFTAKYLYSFPTKNNKNTVKNLLHVYNNTANIHNMFTMMILLSLDEHTFDRVRFYKVIQSIPNKDIKLFVAIDTNSGFKFEDITYIKALVAKEFKNCQFLIYQRHKKLKQNPHFAVDAVNAKLTHYYRHAEIRPVLLKNVFQLFNRETIPNKDNFKDCTVFTIKTYDEDGRMLYGANKVTLHARNLQDIMHTVDAIAKNEKVHSINVGIVNFHGVHSAKCVVYSLSNLDKVKFISLYE